MAQLIDDVQQAGLTVDSYLKSKNMTSEKLRDRYEKEVKDMYKLEFMLQSIADKEKIRVDEKEIQKYIDDIKNDSEKKMAQNNIYLLAMMMRKQKVLDFLDSL